MRIVLAGLLFGLLTGCQVILLEDRVGPVVKSTTIAPTKVVAIEGSEAIGFIDQASSQLNVCRQLSRLRLTTSRPFEEAVVELRNRAHILNANMMIPVMIKEKGSYKHPENHLFIVDLVRCRKNTSKESTAINPSSSSPGGLDNG